MKIEDALNGLFRNMTVGELRMMKKSVVNQKLTYNSILYLDLIYADNGRCTVSSIAKTLKVSKPAITLKVNELIKQGYVTKLQSESDRRVYYLAIDEQRVPEYKLYRKQDQLAAKRLTQNYTEAEVEQFCEMLTLVSDIYGEELVL